MAKTFPKGKRKSFRKKTFSKPKSNKAFVKKVQSIIHADVETKQAFHSITAESFNSGINASSDTKRIVPTITQGTADYQRIGDQLKALTLTVKGAIVYNPTILPVSQYGTYANSRLGIRLMVVQPRQYANLDDVQLYSPTWTALLLKKGGNVVGFTGVLSDLWAPINSDAIITYYDRIMYMTAPYQVTAVGSQVMSGSTKMINIKMKCRNKVLKYDTTVSLGAQPTNYAPVLCIGYVHMDGSSPDVSTTAIQMSFDSVLDYEDA